MQTGADIVHTFAQNGVYDATLVTVTDDDGAANTSKLIITVNNVAPILDTAATKTGDEGTAVEFEAMFDDVGNDDLSVTWDFGDGSEAITTNYLSDSEVTKEVQSHVYQADGMYTATVTVTDSDGAITESTVGVAINNVAPVIGSLTGDTEIDEGDTASFNAIATDAGNDELTYTWDFGDGSEAITVSEDELPIEHTYSDNGDYAVTLIVTDTAGATDTSNLNVIVNNTNPVITEISEDLTINEGDAVNLSAMAIDAGDDDLTYAWDFGDGSDSVMGQNIEHIFVDNGLYEAMVTVTDDDGAAISQSLSITVNNVAPIIDPWSDKTATEGDTVEFAASFSDSGILDTHTVIWDFGDGNKAVDTLIPEHIYVDNGVYEVTLSITDNDGATTSSTISVTIDNAVPQITSLTAEPEVDEGNTARFSVIATDRGADELTYTWDFGDASKPVTGKDVYHGFGEDGDYTVEVTARDDDGASTSQTHEIRVNNLAPVITKLEGDNSVDEGAVARFSADASDFADSVTYYWNFGDGQTATGKDVAHAYGEDGNYTVELTVTDDDGVSTTQTHEITVNNLAPVITKLEGDKEVDEGAIANFSATASDFADSVTYHWNFGDGQTATGKDVAHAYGEDGNYTVELTVTDDDGVSTTQTHEIRVNNLTPVITKLEGDNSVDEGAVARFSADASDFADAVTYYWNFGDGQTATGKDVAHAYGEDGNYTVELTVTDDDGISVSQSLEIQVNSEFSLSPLSVGDVPGLYQITAEADNVIDLNFNLIGQNADYRSEIGIIVLDNEQGQVDEKFPGDEGYTKAALNDSRKQILFESGAEVGALKQLSLSAEDYIVFYIVQNDSSANVISSDTNAAPVFFSAFSNSSNFDQFDHFQQTVLGESEMVIGIEDLLGGGDSDFDDVILSVTPKNLIAPGNKGETITTTAIYEGRSAQLDSEVGLIVYDNHSGRVNNLRTSDTGYARAALTSLTRYLLFNSDSSIEETKTIDLPAGKSLGLYLVVGGTFEEWLEYNPDNLATGKPYVLFDHPLANPDQINHFNRWGKGELAIEDLLGGGDLDFNDIRIRLKFEQSIEGDY